MGDNSEKYLKMCKGAALILALRAENYSADMLIEMFSQQSVQQKMEFMQFEFFGKAGYYFGFSSFQQMLLAMVMWSEHRRAWDEAAGKWRGGE